MFAVRALVAICLILFLNASWCLPQNQPFSLQPGDALLLTISNQIWRLPAGDTTGKGEFIASPPFPLWGVATGLNGGVYYVYRQDPNDVLAKLNPDGSSETLATIRTQNVPVGLFLADIVAGPTGNVYLAYRSQKTADTWIAKVGPDKKLIDLQNGQELTGAFASKPFAAGFGAYMAVNSKDQLYVSTVGISSGPNLYRANSGSPVTPIATINGLRGLAFTGDDSLWGSIFVSTSKVQLVRINIPAAKTDGGSSLSWDVSGPIQVDGNGNLEADGTNVYTIKDQTLVALNTPTGAVSTRACQECSLFFTGNPGNFALVKIGLVKRSETSAGLYSFSGLPTGKDPVVTSTGEFIHTTLDIQLGGPLPIQFGRYYGGLIGPSVESNGFFAANDSSMGANWVHNFSILLRRIDSSNVVVYYYDGKTIYFRKSASAWTLAQPGASYKGTLYQLIEAGTKLKMMDPESQIVFSFDTSGMTDGAVRGVESISDRNGNTHSLTYNADGTLAKVADGQGRSLEFTYVASAGKPRISKVTDQSGRAIQFEYSDAQLTRTTDARGKVSTYATNASSLIESITHPGGNTPVRNIYTSGSPKVTQQADGLGNLTKFAYNADNTVMTDALGNTRTHFFNNELRFVKFTDEAGKSIQFGYDTSQRKTSTTDRIGDTNTINYDPASGMVNSRTDNTGKTWRYTYGAQELGGFTFYNITRIDYPDGNRDLFNYDARGNLISQTDRAGKTWTYTYNDRGQVLTATNPDNGVTSNSYNADGTLASLKDPAGNTTTLGYDALRRLNRIVRPDSSTVQYTYDANDNILTRVNEKGKTTAYTYDDNNNLKTVANPLGKTWTFAYDGNEKLAAITDPLGKTTTFAYDALQRLKSVTDRNGNATAYNYSASGRLASVVDAAGKTSAFTYDDEGVVTSFTSPLGRTWRYTSDKQGRISSLTDPLSNQARYEYDALSRLISWTNPLSETTSYRYDERGLLTGASQPGPIAAGYTRNNLGRITQINDPRGRTRTRTYDNLARLTSSIDPLGNVTRLTYDQRNRPSRTDLPLGTLNFTYDEVGLITTLNYSDGTRIDYSYDDNNRLTSAGGSALSYDDSDRLVSTNGISVTRDSGGRIETMTMAPGKVVTYSYDSRNLLTSVSDWAGGTIRLSYDDGGRLLSITRPNGVITTYSYDNADRLAGILQAKNQTTLSSITLVKDSAGQTKQAARDVPLAPTAAQGNRDQTYNDADQIIGYTYDAMGRLTGDGVRSYTWDLASRLTSYAEGQSAIGFTYDGFGNLLTRSEGGKTRSFIWNYALGLPSISVIKDDGNTARYYIHTPGGTLLYSIEAVGNTRRFYHYDELGSTLFLTDDSGSITDSYAYSSYGQLTGSSGNSDNPFTYIGRYGVMREGSSGLYYMRARYYDSVNGRFLSRDPISFDLAKPKFTNPYQYVAQNPQRYVDPFGTQDEPPPGDENLVARIRRLADTRKREIEESLGGGDTGTPPAGGDTGAPPAGGDTGTPPAGGDNLAFSTGAAIGAVLGRTSWHGQQVGTGAAGAVPGGPSAAGGDTGTPPALLPPARGGILSSLQDVGEDVGAAKSMFVADVAPSFKRANGSRGTGCAKAFNDLGLDEIFRFMGSGTCSPGGGTCQGSAGCGAGTLNQCQSPVVSDCVNGGSGGCQRQFGICSPVGGNCQGSSGCRSPSLDIQAHFGFGGWIGL